MSHRFPEARLVVMAKAPVPGQAKTRLIPALGPEGAARLQADLLRSSVLRLLESRLCPLVLACAPGADHPAFAALAARGAALEVQVGADLGERMERAARRALAAARRAVVVGADIPGLGPAQVASALLALRQGSDAVLGPAEDGGYCLLGLNRIDPALFRDIAWGSSGVAEATRGRIRGLGWRWEELPPLWDIDRPEDLLRLAEWRRADPGPHCALGADSPQGA
jgi:rSAM/selenodomain-associated transferase 1